LPDALLEQIKQRGEKTESIRVALERYFYTIDRSRRSIQEVFTAEECSLILDTCNGTWFEPHSLDGVPLEIQDVEESRMEHWGVDRAGLLAKLQGLTLAQHAALVDAIERWWRAAGTGIQINPGDLLK